MDISKISEYYDTILPFYRLYFGSSYGFHSGHFKPETKSKKEAVLNVNQFLAEQVGIKDNDLILDAGCGIGGSCIWLAQNYKVKTVGITISKRQLGEAKNLAKKLNLSKKTEYYLMDFIKTSFKDDKFDVVWSIESVVHAKNKCDFLKEAKRIMKKKGRLIIADYFLARNPKNKLEKQFLKDFLEGFTIDNVALMPLFEQDLKRLNFKKIKHWDKTEIIGTPTWLYKSLRLVYPLFILTEQLKITPKSLSGTLKAAFALYDGAKSGLFKRGIFFAEK